MFVSMAVLYLPRYKLKNKSLAKELKCLSDEREQVMVGTIYFFVFEFEYM